MDPVPPGTKLFAPQARFRLGEAASSPPSDELEGVDLKSTRITLTHHGPSQVSLVLNNQRHAAGRPVHPPWKYNDLRTLKFGQRIRAELRYGEEEWEPLIVARITDIHFAFQAGQASVMRIEGRDLLSLLDTTPNADKRYRDKSEEEIVREVLTRSQCGLSLASPLVARPTFSDTLRNVTHRKRQTYFKFLESMAERMDFEVFVDVDKRLHFEPARSLHLGTVVDLSWNENLTSFTPKFKVWEQFTNATARGRHPRNRRRIEEEVAEEAITADLHAESGQPQPRHAIDVRAQFYSSEFAGSVPPNEGAVDVSNLDSTRARLKAAAELRKRARQLLTASASTVGFTRLKPGIHVNIKNMYAPFDGLYYVTQATHTLDSSGYRTEVELRRPGMLPPEHYPQAA